MREGEREKEREEEETIKGEERTGKKLTRVSKIVASFFDGTRIHCEFVIDLLGRE